MLEVTNLRFAWPNGQTVLEDVCFTATAGVPLALLGPNGTGKTTLLRCLLGLERPQAGRVIVAGHDLAALSRTEAARLVAYVPQASTTISIASDQCRSAREIWARKMRATVAGGIG